MCLKDKTTMTAATVAVSEITHSFPTHNPGIAEYIIGVTKENTFGYSDNFSVLLHNSCCTIHSIQINVSGQSIINEPKKKVVLSYLFTKYFE